MHVLKFKFKLWIDIEYCSVKSIAHGDWQLMVWLSCVKIITSLAVRDEFGVELLLV